jgi:energy-converting hydrogenase Eha subunit A
MADSNPPIPKVLDYPVVTAIVGVVIFTALLLPIVRHFDPTNGTLTISLIVVLTVVGIAVFSVFFTIPTDEITSAVVGGLVASFGAIIAYWLGKTKGDK